MLRKTKSATAKNSPDEDVWVELSALIVIGLDDGGFPTGFKPVGDGLVYDEAWDGTAELLFSDEAKESKVERSGISGE